MMPKLSGKYIEVTSPFTATKDGWLCYALILKTAGSNAGIDDSNGQRVAYVTGSTTIYSVVPIKKGVTYTSFANGEGAKVIMTVQ